MSVQYSRSAVGRADRDGRRTVRGWALPSRLVLLESCPHAIGPPHLDTRDARARARSPECVSRLENNFKSVRPRGAVVAWGGRTLYS
eukprot:1823131-Prymnesium_polylepis.1